MSIPKEMMIKCNYTGKPCKHPLETSCEGCDIYLVDSKADLITKNDPVNHPAHYTAGGIECIDAIAAALTSQNDPVAAWLTGQCLKYLWRWPLKNGVEDLKKTRFYLDRLIERELAEEGET